MADSLPATAASLNNVAGVALNREAMVLYLTDQVLNRIFRVDLATGGMTIVAGTRKLNEATALPIGCFCTRVDHGSWFDPTAQALQPVEVYPRGRFMRARP